MTTEYLLRQMGTIDPAFIEEAAPGWGRRSSRRVVAVILAAALALLLVSCGVAAAIYGDSIQNWFSHYWEAVTGREMGEGQTAIIDHLTQEIGLSQTMDGITVTVDSATVGDDCFYLLLRVEGADFSKRYSYGFREVDVELSPDPIEEEGGLGGFGVNFHGIDGDGAALLILDWNYSAESGFSRDTRPLEILLTLSDFGRDIHVAEREIFAEATWEFAFTLDRSNAPQVLELPDTEVQMTDLKKQESVSVPITDIQLTSTGIRFCCDDQGGVFAISAYIKVFLKNGASVNIGGGVGTRLEDSEILSCSYPWSVPVDLEEVAGIQIGDTYISVP